VVDLEAEPDQVVEVESRNNGKRIIPTIVFADGSFLAEPSNDELADRIGLSRAALLDTYDLVIIGADPPDSRRRSTRRAKTPRC